MSLIILHHLGLGDHIVCHGLVRAHAEKEPVSLFCKKQNVPSVAAMYTDLPLEIIPIIDLEEAQTIISIRGLRSLSIIIHNYDPETRSGLSFDEIFYKRAEVPFYYKWDKFKIPRNAQKEIPPPKGPYAVVHQDERFKINVNTTLPIYSIDKGITDNLFDFTAVLENAEEIHVIDSTVMFIADQLPCRGKKFVHRYARPNPTWQLPKLTKDWIIL